MTFTLWHDGKEYGPYDLASVEASIASGDLNPKTLAHIGDGRDWQPLESLLPRKPSTERALPAVSAKPKKYVKNKAARRLSYILFALSIGFLVLGVVKGHLSTSDLESLYDEEGSRKELFAMKMRDLAEAAEHGAHIRGASRSEAEEASQGIREDAEKAEAEAERYKNMSDDLAEKRENVRAILWGVAGVLVLAGTVLRVYS
jgi:hypothetical protein